VEELWKIWINDFSFRKRAFEGPNAITSRLP